jgi:hypothetical protein
MSDLSRWTGRQPARPFSFGSGGRALTAAERARRMTDAELLNAAGPEVLVRSRDWTLSQLAQYRCGGIEEMRVDRLRRCLTLHPDVVATLTPSERENLI